MNARTMKSQLTILHLILFLPLAAWVGSACAASGAPRDSGATSQSTVSLSGSTLGLHWNRDLAGDIGLRIGAPNARIADDAKRHFERFAMQREATLALRVGNGRFLGFGAGSLIARGGYLIDLPRGRIDLRDLRIVAHADDPYLLDLVGADGKVWFYVDKLMGESPPGGPFEIRTADVRISAALAARLGQPMVAGWAIADLSLVGNLNLPGAFAAPAGSCDVWTGANCNFAGLPAPGGGSYKADLFMLSFEPQYSRCQGCTGPTGSGDVVFTPSSSLKNNVNAGSIQTTVAGQGDAGKSNALWAADIPWFEKFTGDYPPYGNDQHPFLIWNMYRIDADGVLTQIARSGVKHAFLTVNSGIDCPYGFGHVLGRTCEDTYGTGNNDNSEDLGPRSEIVPATNQWGRCGSIWDPIPCNGNYHYAGSGNYDYRLIANEQAISTAAHPGANWLFESWYLAREDIDIENSMGTVATTQNWNGSVWGISGSGYTLGPAIDRWVDPANPGTNASNAPIPGSEGHARIAVKVSDLGGGLWRYDYAVMNLDFARAQTQGSEPNLRVEANHGFDRFSVALPPGAGVSASAFHDADQDPANDWSFAVAGDRLTWTAPAGNSLDWGTLYAFSATVDAAPVASIGTLGVALPGTPQSYSAAALAPAFDPADIILADGFDGP